MADPTDRLRGDLQDRLSGDRRILVAFNAGSTSLKFAAYAPSPGAPFRVLCRGRVNSLQKDPTFEATHADGAPWALHAFGGAGALDQGGALQFVIAWLEDAFAGSRIWGVGHRILLGGARYEAPVLLTAEALDYLETLTAVDPSHQGVNLQAARAFATAFPGAPQVGCFDTVFHHTMPEVAKRYAVPKAVRDLGVRHWGFHGLSYEYISGRIPAFAPNARRVIAAHLGGGASLCALMDGRSLETTMGFGALSGLPMATRCGDIPPEVLFFLLRQRGSSARALETQLYEASGLLGLSGVSGDIQVLLASDNPDAAAALDYFAYATSKYVAAYVGVLGGLDALVFTAGVGERSSKMRTLICDRLAWLGVQLDGPANLASGPPISSPQSKVSVFVIPTDEEAMIATHTLSVLSAHGL